MVLEIMYGKCSHSLKTMTKITFLNLNLTVPCIFESPRKQIMYTKLVFALFTVYNQLVQVCHLPLQAGPEKQENPRSRAWPPGRAYCRVLPRTAAHCRAKNAATSHSLLQDYENDALNNLKKILINKWDFVTMQAEEQVLFVNLWQCW